ncbi:flagellar basal body rod C-terminal domain-containing protein, partial [Desulfobulbus rhabdoformis]|uniref:flagellar basal body rod C-terminal domain-containing protein n=1 Tax=Desulfobulbus rhabdoformis TaxID=34032 RepID=UPI0023DD0A02
PLLAETPLPSASTLVSLPKGSDRILRTGDLHPISSRPCRAYTGESGTPTLGYPGPSQGTLITQALELSNVDLATEFVDLITIQNAYSASSKVITTTNEMLDELVNLIR